MAFQGGTVFCIHVDDGASIVLGNELEIPILYEDRSALAIDKPAGWLLVPDSWDRTGRNLQLALSSSVQGGEFWARSRRLKFIRYIHRLDAETTGVLLFAKSAGALKTYSELFRDRRVEKVYLAVVEGRPKQQVWECSIPLSTDGAQPGRVVVDRARGQESTTQFRVVESGSQTTLVEARPITGRTHQIRAHLAEAGYPVVGDDLYGNSTRIPDKKRHYLGLRAVALSYRDPFERRTVRISAPARKFLISHGFGGCHWSPPWVAQRS